MAEPAPVRRRRRLWWLLLLVPVLLATVPACRLAAGETVITMQLTGESCGAHLVFEPAYIAVGAGQRIRFVNQTEAWPIAVRLAAEDSPTAAPLLQSPTLQPGESWGFWAWRPGQNYFMTAANPNLYWAGLRGWVYVGW